MEDLFPACHLTVLPAEQAVIASCLHIVPTDCQRLLCIQTGDRPRAATLRIERVPHGETNVLTEDEAVLSDTLAHYLQDGSDAAVARFLRDYRRFHAPTPAVWVCDSVIPAPADTASEDLTVLTHRDAVARGSLLTVRRALWADLLKTM